MKNEIIGVMFAICAIVLCLLLFSTLVPWYAETFGDAEENINAKLQAELDAKACGDYPVKYINNVLYCKCTETESQKPGHCQEKYK